MSTLTSRRWVTRKRCRRSLGTTKAVRVPSCRYSIVTYHNVQGTLTNQGTPRMTASTREFSVPRKLRNTECPLKAHDRGQPTKGIPRRARAIAARGLYHAACVHGTGLLYGSVCCAVAFRTIQGYIDIHTPTVDHKNRAACCSDYPTPALVASVFSLATETQYSSTVAACHDLCQLSRELANIRSC